MGCVCVKIPKVLSHPQSFGSTSLGWGLGICILNKLLQEFRSKLGLRTPPGWPEVNREGDAVHSIRTVAIEIFAVVFKQEVCGVRTRDSRREELSLGGLLAESGEQVSSGRLLGPDSRGRYTGRAFRKQ